MASGKLNRYVFQPGITDVRAQITGISSWMVNNLGKKISMIFPDYAFGYDHRDFLGEAVPRLDGTIRARLAIPPAETSFTKYFARVPANTDVLYHVMVGPGVLTFVKEMGEYFGARKPQIFGFIDSLEGVDIASPGLEFLEGTYLWEALPRYADGYPTPYERFYRKRVGVNDAGASIGDPKDISTYSHMFGCWETLFIIKEAVEQSGYKDPTPKDYRSLIETLENFQGFNEGIQHPQGPKKFVGQIHQSFGQQFISKVENRRLKVIHRTKIEDSLYEPEADYRSPPFWWASVMGWCPSSFRLRWPRLLPRSSWPWFYPSKPADSSGWKRHEARPQALHYRSSSRAYPPSAGRPVCRTSVPSDHGNTHHDSRHLHHGIQPAPGLHRINEPGSCHVFRDRNVYNRADRVLPGIRRFRQPSWRASWPACSYRP